MQYVIRFDTDPNLAPSLDGSTGDLQADEQLMRLALLQSKLVGVELLYNELDQNVPINRQRAIAAIKLLREYHLSKTLEAVANMEGLINGNVTAAEVGFPEFDDDADPSMFV